MWTGKNMVEFMRAQRNEFPQTFCEYVTLGNVAWSITGKIFLEGPEDAWISEPWKVHQAWSHEPPTAANLNSIENWHRMIRTAVLEANLTRHCINRCVTCNHASAFAKPYFMDRDSGQ